MGKRIHELWVIENLLQCLGGLKAVGACTGVLAPGVTTDSCPLSSPAPWECQRV